MKKIIISLLAISYVVGQAALYHKVLLKNPDALCLDGSPGAYYISNGTSPQKILLYFEGGGWCGARDLPTTLQSCYQRSKGNLGSSKQYPDTVSFSQGILSNNANNKFRQYTKVFLKYCDGAGHQGFKSAPISYKDAKLYFRGHNVTQGQLQDVQKSNKLFSQATDIIVTGGSAGGLATFLWVDYVKNKAKAAKNVYGAPDSGIFLDSPNFANGQHSYRNSFINLFKLSNVEINPPVPQCVKANPQQIHKCMFAQQIHKYIKTPLFPIQSLYDTWSLPNILGIACVSGQSLKNCNQNQMNYIEQYHKNTSAVLNQIGKRAQNGYWAPSCAIHGFITGVHFYSADFRIPMKSANSIGETLYSWITKQQTSHKFMDANPWPSNTPCSGVAAAVQ